MTSHARLEITIHIGQTIRVGAIFLFAYRVKTSIVYIVDVSCSIYLYLVFRLLVLMKGQQIFLDTCSYFHLSKNKEISI